MFICQTTVSLVVSDIYILFFALKTNFLAVDYCTSITTLSPESAVTARVLVGCDD
jgi:hypothetical protein